MSAVVASVLGWVDAVPFVLLAVLGLVGAVIFPIVVLWWNERRGGDG